jgi:uncharacterized protein with ATP-grasp and redox domains
MQNDGAEMKITFHCIPCIVNNYLRLTQNGSIPEVKQEIILRRLLDFLSKTDYDQSPPVLGQKLQHLLSEFTHNPDPYKKLKEKSNAMLSQRYLELQKVVENSSDPFDSAMRLAIAGNVIDFGSQYQFDVFDTIEYALGSTLAIDDSLRLRKDLDTAESVLYIGDNAGEIVLDKLFLRTMGHPNVTYVVRGGAAINDATLEDASLVGIDKYAKVITTGDDTPGVVWETSSEEFQKAFEKADVVISKGQGNFEGLSTIKHNIYFLLVVKCDLITKQIGLEAESLVVMRSFFARNRNSKRLELNSQTINE